MPVIELVKWSSSDAYAVADHSVLRPTLDFLVHQKGNLGIYSGLADDAKRTAHCFIIWDSIANHEALMKHPEYPNILKLKPSLGAGYEDMKMNHILFANDWHHAVSAPLTEIMTIKLKEGEGATKEQLRRAIWALAAQLDEDNKAFAPAAWGPTHEDADKCYLLVGWDSTQDHQEIMGGASYKSLLDDLHAAASLEILHVHFKKHV